jgi:hypothetical protein
MLDMLDMLVSLLVVLPSVIRLRAESRVVSIACNENELSGL